MIVNDFQGDVNVILAINKPLDLTNVLAKI